MARPSSCGDSPAVGCERHFRVFIKSARHPRGFNEFCGCAIGNGMMSDSPVSPERLRAAYIAARDALLAERVPAGHWVGELSTSALSTATAVVALHLVNPFEHR